MSEDLRMDVSGVYTKKDGTKAANVIFTREDPRAVAEGTIPDCHISRNEGFTEEEKGQLELYMKMNLGSLKKLAATVNPVRAMMKDGQKN